MHRAKTFPSFDTCQMPVVPSGQHDKPKRRRDGHMKRILDFSPGNTSPQKIGIHQLRYQIPVDGRIQGPQRSPDKRPSRMLRLDSSRVFRISVSTTSDTYPSIPSRRANRFSGSSVIDLRSPESSNSATLRMEVSNSPNRNLRTLEVLLMSFYRKAL